jgi:pyruvate-formate lyase-activating enzyme
MKPKVLLVNPPIYDFAAYDFWLKPYGLLRAGGMLRSMADLSLFDYLDRFHPAFSSTLGARTNADGCGPYPQQRLPKPAALKDIPRYWRRFGLPRSVFQQHLSDCKPDFVLVQTVLTYWYPGVREVIDDVRQICPQAKIVLGGFYATACPDHARSLGPDLVIHGNRLDPLWNLLGRLPANGPALPAWELYPQLKTAVIKLTQGCPFKCSYCFVPQSGVPFAVRSLSECMEEFEQVLRLGVDNIAFYDDSLLYQPRQILYPFLDAVAEHNVNVRFHTPNAMHARFMSAQCAAKMVRAGVSTFYLGFESRSSDFHSQTGSKVVSDELAVAVENLRSAGVHPDRIIVYEMLGHPRFGVQQLEESMRFVNSLGIRLHLSDFSPIPNTPDGELCRSITDLDEPLNHSKTAFPIRFLGDQTSNYYKELCRQLNKTLQSGPSRTVPGAF